LAVRPRQKMGDRRCAGLRCDLWSARRTFRPRRCRIDACRRGFLWYLAPGGGGRGRRDPPGERRFSPRPPPRWPPRATTGGARHASKLEAGFRADAFNYLLVLRLVPIFPFWLVNLVPALVGVRLTTYVLATFLGIIPGTFVYASLGNGLGSVVEEPDLSIIFKPSVLVPIIGLAILALIPVGYKRWRGKKTA